MMKSMMSFQINRPGFPPPRGFTLIEVLVSMGLLSAVLLSMASFIVYGSNLLLRTEQVSIASHILEKWPATSIFSAPLSPLRLTTF
jgi:prepilin-type N-terminal cleavage/methylation domain-containing protein